MKDQIFVLDAPLDYEERFSRPALTPSEKGDYTELLVLARLIKAGFKVAIPYGNQKGWDFLVKIDGLWRQWQVRSVIRAGKNKNKFSANCAVRRQSIIPFQFQRPTQRFGPCQIGDYEVLIVVNSDNNTMWRIPITDLIGKTSIQLTDNKYLW